MSKTDEYIQGVSEGTIITGELTKGAIKRHLNDLKRVGDPDFPFHYDQAAADRAIKFIETLKHVKGKWAAPDRDNRLILESWQHFILSMIFGWLKADGNRRFTKVYVSTARKGGKTTLAAAIMVYVFYADGEIGPEVYSLAMKKDQAKISWEVASAMIERNDYLKSKSRLFKQTSTITVPGSTAKMKPLGRDSDTEDGRSPSCAVIDEYHGHPTADQVEIMAAGMGARDQPLTFIITTAGFSISGPCYEQEYSLSKQILEATLDPVPENFFCIVYEIDKEDDWTNERIWIKANPNLDISVDRQYLRDRVAEGLLSPQMRNKILTKNFNKWTQVITRWFSPEAWQDCAFPVNRKDLAGRECIMGMDLSSSQDLTALALCFPPLKSGDRYEFLWWFFLPMADIIEKSRRDKAPYAFWAEEGYLTLTAGNVVDLELVEQEIKNLAKEFDVKEICYDVWRAQGVVNNLAKDELAEMVAISQNYSGMAAPTDSFEKLVLAKRIAHGNNPIMRWMIANVELKSDRQGNVMPMKPRRETAGKKIDGVVAALFATGRAITYEPPEESIYKTRGVISIG